MRSYIGALTGLLFLVGLLFVAKSLNSPDTAAPETSFLDYDYEDFQTISLPSRNITVNGLSLYIHDATFKTNSSFNNFTGRIHAYYDDLVSGNGINYFLDEPLVIDVWGYDIYSLSNFNYSVLPEYDLRYIFDIYFRNVSAPAIAQAIYNKSNSTSYNYSNSSYNYTNSSSNYSNSSQVYYPDSIYGRNNLTVQLPSRNISFDWKMSVYVYNATFLGNSTYSGDFRGRIYAKFAVTVQVPAGWYSYTTYFDGQDVVFDAYNSYSSNAYYNYSLLNDSTTLRDLLFTYYYNVSTPAIFEALNNNKTSNKTNPSYEQSLPAAYIDGYNLSYWANNSWYDFSNYTSVGYQVIVKNATFEGYTDNSNVNGTIYLRFDAYGNNSYSPSYNQSQIWEYDVNATIKISNNWVYSIELGRPLWLSQSDVNNFLRAYVVNVTNPYLLVGNSSSSNTTNTTGVLFPEMNITGYYLNNVLSGWYSNYTAAGYYVYVYNISYDLQRHNNDVSGWVNLAFVAFGNDTNDTSCQYSWYTRCRQLTVYSNASIHVNEVVENKDYIPYLSIDYGLRVNYTDIQNFLRAYYFGVIVPNITYYYNLTNSTTDRTIYLPDYYNDTQINIDCSKVSYRYSSKVSYRYCSGANPQSSLFFLGAVASNMSFTIDFRGYGIFNGNLRIPYMANLINFTSTYEGKETIIDNLQGNAILYLYGIVSPDGNDSYHIGLTDYPNSSARFDRNYFVQNAVRQLFQDHYYYTLQNFVNSFSSNSTNFT